MANQYVLVERRSQPSRLNGVTMWRLVFYCIDDGVLYETTVDNSYRNFVKNGWDHLVQTDQPWGVYEGLIRSSKTTRDHMPVITADSVPLCVYRSRDRDEALKIVSADQEQRHPDQFRSMFEVL